MLSPRSRRRRLLADINVVPFIDVMLVLLVVFMIATPLLTHGVKLNLPKVSAKTMANQSTPIVISVDQQGQYYLNSKGGDVKLTIHLVAGRVARLLADANNHGKAVLIKADQAVNYGKVVALMAALQQKHITDVGLITDPSVQTDEH